MGKAPAEDLSSDFPDPYKNLSMVTQTFYPSTEVMETSGPKRLPRWSSNSRFSKSPCFLNKVDESHVTSTHVLHMSKHHTFLPRTKCSKR